MAAGPTLTVAVVGTLVLLAVSVALYPHLVTYDDDAGDGLGTVALPKPLSAVHYRRRLFAFFAVGAALTVVANGLLRFQPPVWYADVVGRLATGLTGRPAEVQAYLGGLAVRISPCCGWWRS